MISRIVSDIRNTGFNINQLKLVLNSVKSYVQNPIFVQNIGEIADICSNHQISIWLIDLEFLSRDLPAVIYLVNSIMLIITSIPNVKLQPNLSINTELIFGLLAYIFLIIIPIRLNKSLTMLEFNVILDIITNIYHMLESSNMISYIILETIAKTKSKNWCICLVGPTADSGQDKLDKHLNIAKLNLLESMNNIRIRSELNLLKQKINI